MLILLLLVFLTRFEQKKIIITFYTFYWARFHFLFIHFITVLVLIIAGRANQIEFLACEFSSPPLGSLSSCVWLVMMMYITSVFFLITNQQLLAATGSSLAVNNTLPTVQHSGGPRCDWQYPGWADHSETIPCCALITTREE